MSRRRKSVADSGDAIGSLDQPSQATSVQTIHTTLRKIIGTAGIGLRLARKERPKYASRKAETTRARMKAEGAGTNPEIMRSAPVIAPAIRDALLFARANPSAPPRMATTPKSR